MKVFVITKAKPMEPESYVTVKATMKAAEKYIRAEFPNARKEGFGTHFSFACKTPTGNTLFMFITEEELDK